MESAFRGVWTSFLLAFLVLALCVGAFAQGGVGELSGLVTDPTGAVVAGAPVKLTNSATGEVRTTTTSPAGTYRFPALQVVGTYTLEVNPKGFKSEKVQNIVITVGTIVTRDVQLELGATTEQVTVEAGSQLVQTEDSSLSQNVDRQVWTSMPLETRSQNTFIELLPGAEPAANAMLGTDRGAAVNGTRSGSGNFLVEGFDNNDQGLGGGGSLGGGPGGANTTISPDAIEEYRVIDGTPPAEYGKAGGFVTDTVLKGGTNQWHGSLFEYNRVQALAAEHWFTDNAGQQDHLIRNQFGGSIGGPIIKDKTFFYFTTEFHRLRVSSPLAATTYTDAFSDFVNSGAFASFMESDPGGICNVLTGASCPGIFSTAAPVQSNATLGPVFSSIYNADPLPLCQVASPSCTSQTNGAQGLWTGAIAGLTYPVPIYGELHTAQPDDLNQARYTVKFDHKLSAKDQLNAAYLYDNADETVAFAGNNAIGPTLFDHGRAQNLGITWSHTFSPTILNQFRASYVRHTANFPGDPRVAGAPSILTAFDSPTFGFGNAANLPQFFTENEFVYRDDLSVTKGKHNFKGGAEFRRTRNGSSFDSYKYGYLIADDVEDVLTDSTFTENLESYLFDGPYYGALAEAFTSINPTTGGLPVYYRGFRANEVAAYLQDDWRVNSRLTVNLGVRWEYFGPPHNFQPGVDANFYQGVPVTPIPTTSENPFFPVNSAAAAPFATGVVQQRNHDLWNKDLNNFGPRIGFAWDTMGDQKLVVRGGFGIMYDRIFNNVFENIRFNPPYFAVGELGYFGNGAVLTPSQTSALYTFPYTGTTTFAGAGLTPSLRSMDQNLVTPYYEQGHLGLQYQFGKDYVVESNYVGTFGHKLIGILGRNTFNGRFAGGDATALDPLYGNNSFRTNCCDSNYHGWQTSLRKRYSAGLQLNVNYTYSKGMDDVSDAFTTKNAGSAAYPTDSWDPKLDYGPADYNVKHRAVGSFVYDLPFLKSSRWLGGWQYTGIVSVQTGADFSINNSGVDSNGDGQYNDRAVYIGPGSITNAVNHNVSPANGYVTQSASSWGMLNGNTTALETGIPCVANGGAWCNNGEMERNTLVGPSYFNFDMGFAKGFKITESTKLRFEANFFNIFNHPNFTSIDGNLNSGSFGKAESTFDPRITQLAVRFDF
ncbi:MAG: TonB-dependent receptor [Terriglobales bacterium]